MELRSLLSDSKPAIKINTANAVVVEMRLPGTIFCIVEVVLAQGCRWPPDYHVNQREK